MANLKAEAEKNIAKQYGFTPVDDDWRGYGYCKFVKGDVHVYTTGSGWSVCRLVNGKFKGHKEFRTLQRALDSTV